MAFDTAFTETYEISGNWTAPSLNQQGFRALGGLINVQLYAAGGFGGSNSLARGGGGGGGAFSQTNNIQIQEGQSYQITLGVGRNASFAGVMSADHGKDGTDAGGFLGLSAGDPGAGGTAGNSVGQIRFSGASGQTNQGGGGAGDQGNATGTQGGPRDGGNGNAQNTAGEAFNGGLNSNGVNPVSARGRININYRREWVIGLREIRNLNDFIENRDLSRISTSEVRDFQFAIIRNLNRLSNIEGKTYTDNNSRNLDRLKTNLRNNEVQFQRNIDRFYREVINFQDLITRTVERQQEHSKLFEDNVEREITYVLTEPRYFEETFSRAVERIKQNDKLIVNEHKRTISRNISNERILKDIFKREIERKYADEFLFTVQEQRFLERYLTETRIFEDADVLRSIERIQTELSKMEIQITREINRTENNFKLLDDSFQAEKKTADFDGYNQDVELLLQHSAEWMKEHYGPYIQQILRRIVSQTIKSDDFEI